MTAGQAAEVGERTLLIFDIAPLQEGPGEIAMAETPAAAVDMPDEQPVQQPPTTGGLPVATLTAPPVSQPDSAPPVTGASGGYITSTGADSGSVLTVSRVSIDETEAEPVLVLSGYGPMGSSVQVLVENKPVVTATVSTEGKWAASAPVNTIGHFEVDVVAVNDAGEVFASAAAAQMEIGPPVQTPVPTPAEQSSIIVPPRGATTTWAPGNGIGQARHADEDARTTPNRDAGANRDRSADYLHSAGPAADSRTDTDVLADAGRQHTSPPGWPAIPGASAVADAFGNVDRHCHAKSDATSSATPMPSITPLPSSTTTKYAVCNQHGHGDIAADGDGNQYGDTGGHHDVNGDVDCTANANADAGRSGSAIRHTCTTDGHIGAADSHCNTAACPAHGWQHHK